MRNSQLNLHPSICPVPIHSWVNWWVWWGAVFKVEERMVEKLPMVGFEPRTY